MIWAWWPKCCKQTFVSPSHGSSTQNLALIGQAVLEKMFEIVNKGQTDDDKVNHSAIMYI